MCRHRPPFGPTYASRNPHVIVTPGLSRHSPVSHQPYRNSAPIITANSTKPRHTGGGYYDDKYYTSGGNPPRPAYTSYKSYTGGYSSPKPDKGLSYTSTRDIGGWLGGAALTAGAAYLLRGSNGVVYGSSKDAKDARRAKDRYYDDKYTGRDRGRDRDHDRDRGRDRDRYYDDGYDRGKSRHRDGGNGGKRAKSERRDTGGGRDARRRYYD